MGFLTSLLRFCNRDPEPLYDDSDGEEIYAPRPIRIVPVNKTGPKKQTGPTNRARTMGKGVRKDERVWWKEQGQTERWNGLSSFRTRVVTGSRSGESNLGR